MGKPNQGHAWLPIAEYIGNLERTRGTETSKYPMEEKEISMLLVAASEKGTVQTKTVYMCADLAVLGL